MFLKKDKGEVSLFAIEKGDYSLLRIKKALPLFFLFWGGAACSGFFLQKILYNHLYTIEQQQTRWLLEHNVELTKSHSNTFFTKIKNNSPVNINAQELLFIRIVKDNEQILLTRENAKGLNFTSLATLQQKNNINKNGVWLRVPGLSQRITIYTKALEVFSIQAGKDSNKSWQFYRQIRQNIWLFIVSLPLFLFPLCLLIVKKAAAPLIDARQKTAQLVDGNQKDLLFESGNGSEFDSLCHEINRLLLRNRKLTEEMQHSLDNVAHDLRTPMARLRSVAEYGLREENPEKLQGALADCLDEAEQVLAMLSVMMSVAEAEAGTMRLEKYPVDLQESLQRAATLYEYVAEEKDITISLKTEPLPAYADTALCMRVWANLLDNAIKYGKTGGWVKIKGYRKLEKEQEKIIIHFCDNGMGIAKTEQDRIWERLYRGDRSRTQRGLGLGLNYVRAVIEAYGGTISVKSELNKGAEFIVSLPAKINGTF